MFYLEKLVKLLIGLPSLLSILAIAAAYFYFSKKRKIAYILLAIFMVFTWLISTPIGVYMLVKPLIQNLGTIDSKELLNKDYNILVLGGGCRNCTKQAKAEQLSNPSLRRLIEGVRLWKLHPESQLIVSGIDWSRNCNIAEIESNLAQEWGTDTSKILELNPVLNTRQEATLYLEKYGKAKLLVLVTSAIHTPRAKRNFEKLGIKVLVAPTDFPLYFGSSIWLFILPEVGNIEKSSAAWIEWMALISGK